MVMGINDILFDHTSNAFLGDNYFIVKKVSRGKERNVDINILNSYDHHCREFRVDHLTFFCLLRKSRMFHQEQHGLNRNDDENSYS